MPTFKVKTPLRHDGKDYAPGDTVDLSAKEAKAISHAVELIKNPKQADEEGKEKN
ncbi:MAG TPA: hypothetical protein VJW20_20250 [Candidatus Angelobacter sp.]|nr:hypothetical protein [Candidatus Angelobacter sp.]